MSTSLYSFSEETLKTLKKFRFSSARSGTLQALIYQIDKKTYEIKLDNPNIITDLDDLNEELPDNTPRYIILSYPVTLSDGRKSTPLVLVYYLPPTSTQEARMLYASAVELIREKAGVSRIIEAQDEDDILELPQKFE